MENNQSHSCNGENYYKPKRKIRIMALVSIMAISIGHGIFVFLVVFAHLNSTLFALSLVAISLMLFGLLRLSRLIINNRVYKPEVLGLDCKPKDLDLDTKQ